VEGVEEVEGDGAVGRDQPDRDPASHQHRAGRVRVGLRSGRARFRCEREAAGRQYHRFERDLIRARTSEGRARAVANGVRLGRKPTLAPHQRREAIKRVNAGKETLGEIALLQRQPRTRTSSLDC
jgi:hypothetical protein